MPSTEQRLKAIENKIDLLHSEVSALRQRIGRTWEAVISTMPVRFVPLVTPLTHTSFDGDAFSDVGANTKIENTGWSTAIPADAVAVLLHGQCRDSGSAATAGLFFVVCGGVSESVYPFTMSPSGKANDDWAYAFAVVPCTDGDVWYKANASGAGTMDVYLRCYGYWVPVGE